MKFSVALPTCAEGLSCPVPFVNTEQMVEIARLSEQFGYHSVWGNDHLSTQTYVKQTFPDPPNYFEVLITLAVVAAHTTQLRLGTGILVLPVREPVLLAKQLATLDQFSNGRVLVGVGVGAYREEFEAVYPGRGGVNRGEMLEESLQALRLLLHEREASFNGRYFQFKGVESYPKPRQDPLPFYVAGNTARSIQRAARWGQGWMPASLPEAALADGVRRLRRATEEYGRDPAALDIGPQYGVMLSRDHDRAVASYQESQGFRHLVSLKESTMKDIDEATFVDSNLIGTPAEVIDKIGRLRDAGMTHCAALCFDTNTVEEMYEQMQFFAEDVMPAFG